MKIETTVTLSPDELNKYIMTGLSDADLRSAQLTVVISKEPAPSIPTPPSAQSQTPSTAPIGQVIDGFHITHYGYPGDSSPDSNSMKGIGDRGNKLVPGVSVALNKLARQQLFHVEQPSTGKAFTLPGVLDTFMDDDSAPEVDVPRIDVYDPYYAGRDIGNTDEMYAKSKAEMVAAGILPA